MFLRDQGAHKLGSRFGVCKIDVVVGADARSSRDVYGRLPVARRPTALASDDVHGGALTAGILFVQQAIHCGHSGLGRGKNRLRVALVRVLGRPNDTGIVERRQVLDVAGVVVSHASRQRRSTRLISKNAHQRVGVPIRHRRDRQRAHFDRRRKRLCDHTFPVARRDDAGSLERNDIGFDGEGFGLDRLPDRQRRRHDTCNAATGRASHDRGDNGRRRLWHRQRLRAKRVGSPAGVELTIGHRQVKRLCPCGIGGKAIVELRRGRRNDELLCLGRISRKTIVKFRRRRRDDQRTRVGRGCIETIVKLLRRRRNDQLARASRVGSKPIVKSIDGRHARPKQVAENAG